MTGKDGGRDAGRAERLAAERGCVGSWLTTFTFQARGFYEKVGFRWIRNWLPYRVSGQALAKLERPAR